MKKSIFTLVQVIIFTIAFAQVPNKMSYQAVIRNNQNTLVSNQAVGMRVSILQGSATGTAVYVETHAPTTNTNGLVSIEIGGGTVLSGSFSTIDWANGPYFVKTETDPNGLSNYSITGISQLLSVPYALYAAKVSLSGGASQWINGLNNSIYYKKGISRVGIGVVNPNAGLDVKRIGNNNLGTIYLANFEALDTTGSQGYDHGAFVRLSTNDYRGRLDLGGSQFNAPTSIGSLLHTTGGWQWNTQLNIIGKVGIGTNSPVFPLQVNGNVYLFNRGHKLIFGSGVGLNDSTFAIYRPIGTDGIMMEANDIYIKSRITPIQLQSGSTINMMDLFGNTKMIVNPQTGNVGIGTTSPARSLHVNSVMRLEPIASAPSNPAKGDMYFDSTINKLRVYDGTTWQNCW